MVFKMKGIVALITGGASGIGLQYAKALLRNELMGVTLADFNTRLGHEALKQIEEEFGSNKAIFVETDVTKINQMDDAFNKTIEKFGSLDIFFNNAGILNDATWEKQIQVNINGATNGMLLAMDKYLPKYKQGPEALIVNVSSIVGLDPSAFVPIYTATKNAILGLSRAWGQEIFYERNKVRVVAVCPGITNTPMISEMGDRSLGPQYKNLMGVLAAEMPTQDPETLAAEVMEVVKYAPHGSTWVIEGGEPAYQYIFQHRRTMKGNVLSKS